MGKSAKIEFCYMDWYFFDLVGYRVQFTDQEGDSHAERHVLTHTDIGNHLLYFHLIETPFDCETYEDNFIPVDISHFQRSGFDSFDKLLDELHKKSLKRASTFTVDSKLVEDLTNKIKSEKHQNPLPILYF